jgi:hypothetical protein
LSIMRDPKLTLQRMNHSPRSRRPRRRRTP